MRAHVMAGGVFALLLASLLASVSAISAPARAEGGWLPDSGWGPWYRFTDPSGANPDGMAPVEYHPRLVVVDDAGRFVVAGTRYDNTQGTACDTNPGSWARRGDQHLVISRYLPDGRSDQSFGSDGSVVVPNTAHGVEVSDLVVSGAAIYVAAFMETGACGPLTVQPPPPPSTVVRVTGSGVLDPAFGTGGVWNAGDTTDEVHLAALDEGAVGAFYESTFAYLSRSEIVETDLSETLCSGREVLAPDYSARTCPRSGRIASWGSTVAITLAWSGQNNRAMRVFFGRLRDGRLVPDYRVSQTGIEVIDVSQLTGGREVWPGSNWLAWDRAGRLVSVLTVTEQYPALVTMGLPGHLFETVMTEMPHGRGLVAARFVADPQGGWRLDASYAEGGLAYVALPAVGPESIVVTAMGLDSDDRPVLAGIWWNPSAPFSSQLVLRLTADGLLDPDFGQAGVTWLPADMPNLRGRTALDNRDNHYFASVWSSFATRARDRPPYQLGRISARGRVQLHDGRAWRDARQQSRPRLAIRLAEALPSVGRIGKAASVRARVVLVRGSTPLPVKGIRVSVRMVPSQGPADRKIVARGVTNAQGEVNMRITLRQSGYYFLEAVHPHYVNAGTPMQRITVSSVRDSRVAVP